MTRVGYGDLLKIPNARWGKGTGGVPWLLRATFGGGDQAAPLSSPLGAPAVEVGSLVITDTGNILSISSDRIGYSSANPPIGTVGWQNAAAQARVAGLAVIASLNAGSTQPAYTGWLGWWRNTSVAFAGGSTTNVAGLFYSELGAMRMINNGAASVFIPVTIANNSAFALAVVLRSAGEFYFAKNPTTWTLAWVDDRDTTANVYATSSPGSSGATATMSCDSFGSRQLPAPFNSDYGIASQNVASPVSGTSYTATADAITDLTLTAPNPLTDQAGYRYRYTDDDNCWHSYFNSAGAYRLDSVAASVATNRINVAAVIAAAGSATMRTMSNSSVHNAYTKSGPIWTKRGSQINVSHLNTNTAIRPYVTGSWAMSNLRSYPVTDPRYDAELNKT